MPVTRHKKELAALGQRLATPSFDGEVWTDSLEALRTSFGADGALAYRVAKAPNGWNFEFLHKALARDDETQKVFDAFTKFVTAASKPWPAYDPVRPARWQRNRAVSEHALSGRAGSRRRLARLYEAMGAPWKDPDQVRVLVCDGARLLGWVGVVSRERLSSRAAARLQELVPALRSRLIFDDLVRERDLSRASFDAAFDAIGAPSLLLDAHGRVLHLNDAAHHLERMGAEAFRAARRAHEQPDHRCEVRRIAISGMPAALLVTLRSHDAFLDGEAGALGWHLTPRQLAVLELVVAGLSNKQVAADLGISEGTVELHMTAILKKSRTESRAALLAKYFTQTSVRAGR